MQFDKINVRYGGSVSFAVSTDDVTATTATFYVGKMGETPVITKPIALDGGIGAITLEPADTRVPEGEYNYQVNILHSDGFLEKYPEPEDCEDGELPVFEVHPALDEGE